MKLLPIFSIILSFAIFSIYAANKDTNTSSKEDLRILKLLPPFTEALAIEPAIPTNFIAMSPNGDSSIYEWTYWGPRNVLEAYFKDPKSLSQAIIRVTLSQNTQQNQIGRSQFDKKELNQMLKQLGAKGYQDFDTKWGDYPVYSIKVDGADETFALAWVGLNVPQGWTMMFSLVYPESHGRPSKEDMDLWMNFLNNTKQLSDQLFFKAHGLDMEIGSTIVDVNGSKVKFVAEKKEKDQLTQVVIIPLDADVTVSYGVPRKGLMGAKWMHGEPLVKLACTFTLSNDKWNIVLDQVVSVLIKPVTEFSFTPEEVEKYQTALIYE